MRFILSWQKILILAVAAVTLSGCNPFRPNKAGLQILTNDVPSGVFLNGEYLDKTPYVNKDLKPGEYTIKIQPEKATLVPYETTVTLRPGLLTVITWKPGDRPETSGGVIYELEKLRSNNDTAIAVTSLPDGAIVTLDNQPKEFAPFQLEGVGAGHHQLAISLPSYESQEHTINVIAGHKLLVTVKLARATAPPVPENTPTSTLTATDSAQLSASGSARTATASSTPATPYVKISTTNYFVDGVEVLRVRDKAGAGGAELGAAPIGSMYPYLNETTAGWHKIEFNDKEGWVSGQFSTLVR